MTTSTAIAIQPMQWSEVPDINAVQEFSAEDERCFREIRDVLKKYNALDRFGLTLVHTHFDINDDEVMVETTDVEARTQLVRPMKKTALGDQRYSITNWRLAEGENVVARTCICTRTDQGHPGRHGAN